MAPPFPVPGPEPVVEFWLKIVFSASIAHITPLTAPPASWDVFETKSESDIVRKEFIPIKAPPSYEPLLPVKCDFSISKLPFSMYIAPPYADEKLPAKLESLMSIVTVDSVMSPA